MRLNWRRFGDRFRLVARRVARGYSGRQLGGRLTIRRCAARSGVLDLRRCLSCELGLPGCSSNDRCTWSTNDRLFGDRIFVCLLTRLHLLRYYLANRVEFLEVFLAEEGEALTTITALNDCGIRYRIGR